MSGITDEQLQELETKYKRVAHIKGKGDPTPWEIVLRKPTRPEYKRYRSMSHNPSQVADAQELLVRQICVFPPLDVLDALLDDYPAIPEAVGGVLSKLVGMQADEDLKF